MEHTKSCLLCDSPFTKKLTESKRYWETKRFCSPVCARKHESVVVRAILPQKTCDNCQGEFIKDTKLSYKQWEDMRFCSRVCSYQDAERNKKIGLSALGNTYAKGLIPWNKGKTGLVEVTEEMRKKCSEAQKKRVAEGRHHLWKGGITPIVREIRNSLEMRLWKRSVLERDDFTCQHCNVRGCVLNADHIKEFSVIMAENNIKTWKTHETVKSCGILKTVKHFAYLVTAPKLIIS